MPRTYRQYLEDIEDIVEAAQIINRFTDSVAFEEFRDNDMMVGAVLHYLQVIGEATKRVPEAIRAKYPDVEWRKITGLRDVLAHQYFVVDLARIWDVVQNKLPALHLSIAAILAQEEA
jgi:uncharacterized protein with HEPN domain